MSRISAPYGLRVVKYLGETPFSGGIRSMDLTTNQANGYFFGDPVGLSGGNPVPITGTPTTLVSPNSPVGIFMGASWVDPVRGFVNAQYLPANAISNGATKVKLKIFDYPWVVMQVQANGSVAASKLGLNAVIAGVFGTGNTATGDSVLQIDAASVAATATFAVKIIDFVRTNSPAMGPSSVPGDAFTDCLVIWNAGVHRWASAAGL
jgi:hypothetical protein